MSRSYRHTPISGVGAYGVDHGEKWWKQKANRALRRRIRQMADDEQIVPTLRDVSDVWTWPKDGKAYWHEPCNDDWRRMMRK